MSRMYRVTTFWTFSGKRKFVDLGDHAYGEWIIYDGRLPKFHINAFRENSRSDSIIKELIENKDWTIEKIIARINQLERKKLGFGKRPWIEIVSSSVPRTLELKPLDIEWLDQLS